MNQDGRVALVVLLSGSSTVVAPAAVAVAVVEAAVVAAVGAVFDVPAAEVTSAADAAVVASTAAELTVVAAGTVAVDIAPLSFAVGSPHLHPVGFDDLDERLLKPGGHP